MMAVEPQLSATVAGERGNARTTTMQITDIELLTAVENGGAGRSKMVALGGVDLP